MSERTTSSEPMLRLALVELIEVAKSALDYIAMTPGGADVYDRLMEKIARAEQAAKVERPRGAGITIMAKDEDADG